MDNWIDYAQTVYCEENITCINILSLFKHNLQIILPVQTESEHHSLCFVARHVHPGSQVQLEIITSVLEDPLIKCSNL